MLSLSKLATVVATLAFFSLSGSVPESAKMPDGGGGVDVSIVALCADGHYTRTESPRVPGQPGGGNGKWVCP